MEFLLRFLGGTWVAFTFLSNFSVYFLLKNLVSLLPNIFINCCLCHVDTTILQGSGISIEHM